LRQLRLRISNEEKVPPYVILHDRTLKEIAALKPASLEEMQGLHGIGKVKLEKYGRRFLDVVSRHGVDSNT
jgi:ATP-dependent DNA helicase RecQ